jgi:hypothetical protein
MIPQENAGAVTRALREAFGVEAFEDIRKLSTGPHANFVCRILVRGQPFLLRIVTRRGMPEREFACLKIAADAGLAPRIWYANAEDRISITDFVEAQPFPASEAPVRMGRMLRAVHALPPFPRGVDHLDTTCMFLMHKGAAAGGFLENFRAANILSNEECDHLFASHARLASGYPSREEDMVSSHNDLFKPDNILFDGERVWLVDWEASFLNDRYADLAVVANLITRTEEDEVAYLQAYFGEQPDDYQRARFFVVRQIAHLFYAMGFLLIGSAGQPIDRSGPAPEFRDFQRRMWTREIELTDNPTRIACAMVHWEQLKRNIRQPRFEEALRTIS